MTFYKLKNILYFLLMFSLIPCFCGSVGAEICNCQSCSDCNSKLNKDSCSIVILTADIINHRGTCINDSGNFSNKIFDCQKHTIAGDKGGEDYGIYLNGKSGNTIRNCVIIDFWDGISLQDSSNNNIINNTVSNMVNGVGIW